MSRTLDRLGEIIPTLNFSVIHGQTIKTLETALHCAKSRQNPGLIYMRRIELVAEIDPSPHARDLAKDLLEYLHALA